MRTALGVAGFVLVLAYPAAVYYGLTQLAPRQLAFVLVPLLVVGALARIPKERGQAVRDGLKLPAVMALLLALTALFDDRRFLLATPVLINAVLLAGFAGSLRTARPIVERFARMQVDDLSAAEIDYCRTVTKVWSLFFVVNGAVAALLALLAPLSWWALYTGIVAYVLMGLLGASEYVVRKYRFGRFSGHLLDRALQSVLPQRRVNG
jgi:uncharacterized membrane protein